MDVIRLRLADGGHVEITVLGDYARVRGYDATGTLLWQVLKRLPNNVYSRGVWHVFALVQFIESI